jgi:hypothetical protein
MTMTERTVATAETSSGLFAEGVGGIATIVLAILALSGLSPDYLLAIATIVFGAALLIEGTSMAANYANVLSVSPAGEIIPAGSQGLSALLLGAISGIILGVLALIGIADNVLVSSAIIVFGCSLLLNGTAMSTSANAGIGSAGGQLLAGVTAIVLGILALAGQGFGQGAAQGAAGNLRGTLDLVALLVLGAAILVTGNGMNKAVMTVFMSSRRT